MYLKLPKIILQGECTVTESPIFFKLCEIKVSLCTVIKKWQTIWPTIQKHSRKPREHAENIFEIFNVPYLLVNLMYLICGHNHLCRWKLQLSTTKGVWNISNIFFRILSRFSPGFLNSGWYGFVTFLLLYIGNL